MLFRSDWHAIASRASIAFPVCTLTLILTGAWMVGNSSVTWQTSWVAASAVGATFLMVAGAALGARGARLRAQLEAQVSAHPDRRPVAPTDPVMALLGDANTGVALALVIVMTIKAGLGASLAIIVAGGAAGALAALRGMRDTRLEHAGESQATQMGAYTGT